MESWSYKRDKLAKLIKFCSDYSGGDDKDWLKEYGLEIINTWRDNLDEPIAACESLILAMGAKITAIDERSNTRR